MFINQWKEINNKEIQKIKIIPGHEEVEISKLLADTLTDEQLIKVCSIFLVKDLTGYSKHKKDGIFYLLAPVREVGAGIPVPKEGEVKWY